MTVKLLRQESELGWTEAVFRAPVPRLQPYVEGEYLGWSEHVSRPATLRETPTPMIPVIFNLGAPWRLSTAVMSPRSEDSFLAGLDEHYTLVESSGRSRCLQVNFTPLGALRLLGLPLSEIAHGIFAVEDVLGAQGRDIVARLRDTADWPTRFDLLEEFILARFARDRDAMPGAAWAWTRLRDRDGLVPIGDLAIDLGWSRKRLIAIFHREFGLTPKRAARVMRFERVVRSLDGVAAPRWAEIAAECGYYDQAHLNRDFREFAGVTPAQYFSGILPSYGVPGY